jgi:hypothetical protein
MAMMEMKVFGRRRSDLNRLALAVTCHVVQRLKESRGIVNFGRKGFTRGCDGS